MLIIVVTSQVIQYMKQQSSGQERQRQIELEKQREQERLLQEQRELAKKEKELRRRKKKEMEAERRQKEKEMEEAKLNVSIPCKSACQIHHGHDLSVSFNRPTGNGRKTVESSTEPMVGGWLCVYLTGANLRDYNTTDGVRPYAVPLLHELFHLSKSSNGTDQENGYLLRVIWNKTRLTSSITSPFCTVGTHYNIIL